MLINNINFKMSVYRDCTLVEMMMVGGLVLLTSTILFFLITRGLFGYGSIGVALSLILLVPFTRLLLGQLQKLKYGKPYGYYQQLFVKTILKMNLISAIYLIREGKWSVRRYQS